MNLGITSELRLVLSYKLKTLFCICVLKMLTKLKENVSDKSHRLYWHDLSTAVQ